MNTKEIKRQRRHTRVRKSIASKDARPRLCVHRSNRYVTGQIIDDSTSKTLAYVTSKGLSGDTYTARAASAGTAIAELAKTAGVERVVFDRGGYLYTGRVKAFAEAARNGGLEF